MMFRYAELANGGQPIILDAHVSKLSRRWFFSCGGQKKSRMAGYNIICKTSAIAFR